jgi:hypothetical protein
MRMTDDQILQELKTTVIDHNKYGLGCVQAFYPLSISIYR